MTRKQKRDFKNMIINILSYITITIMLLAGLFVAYLALDFLGLVAWVLSEQTPTGFYLGKLTAEVLRLIIR